MLTAYARPFISPLISDADQSVDAFTTTVAPSVTGDVDTTALAEFCALKYKVCVFNVAQDKFKTFELFCSKKSGGTVEDQMYAISGDTIDFDVNFVVVATNAILQVTNNEAYTLTVEGVKIN